MRAHPAYSRLHGYTALNPGIDEQQRKGARVIRVNIIQIAIGLSTGLVIGYYSAVRDAPPQRIDSTPPAQQQVTDMATTNPFLAESAQQQLQRLNEELAQARQRIVELEQSLDEPLTADPGEDQPAQKSPASPPAGERLTTEHLLQAGVPEILAEDIINRISQHQFRLLQLQNRATREGYLKSPRYFRERRKLDSEAISLRDEIGDEAYDRYLYLTGQNNRVVVTSVMSGSPAELYDIRKDDIILQYAGNRILSWQDIRRITAVGTQSEYANLTILRNGKPLNIVLPGGPLGVRLGTTRLDPTPGDPY